VSAADRIDFGSLVDEHRAHGSIYTDPAIFDAELDRIFHRGWVYVGHESEVPGRGDFCLRPIGRQPVIMVRGDDDEVRVLMNRCPHRGAQVCVLERGNAKGFACAYHGWSFGNTGRLIGVPKREGYGDTFRKEDFGLRPAPRVEKYRGLVFACLHADAPPLDEHLGPLAKAEINVAFDLSPAGRIEVNAGIHKYGYDGNWKLQLENSVDGYHLNYLHRAYMQIMAQRDGSAVARIGAEASEARTRSLGNGHVAWDFRPLSASPGGNPVAGPPTTARWRKDYEESLIEARGRKRAADLIAAGAAHILIFPNLVMLAAQIRTIRPIAVDRTEVFLYPTLLGSVPEEVNRERLRKHESFYGPAGGGATDDLEVFERINTGLRATVDPWINISRGLQRQKSEPDGSLVCNITDELGSRAILHHWRDAMTARDSAASSAAPSKLSVTRNAR
jgi:phenylpropionate dioxygenase-like ring-hydroxylating dioxygenase large terminal subunit